MTTLIRRSVEDCLGKALTPKQGLAWTIRALCSCLPAFWWFFLSGTLHLVFPWSKNSYYDFIRGTSKPSILLFYHQEEFWGDIVFFITIFLLPLFLTDLLGNALGFYGWRNWSLERVRDLPQVSECWAGVVPDTGIRMFVIFEDGCELSLWMMFLLFYWMSQWWKGWKKHTLNHAHKGVGSQTCC